MGPCPATGRGNLQRSNLPSLGATRPADRTKCLWHSSAVGREPVAMAALKAHGLSNRLGSCRPARPVAGTGWLTGLSTVTSHNTATHIHRTQSGRVTTWRHNQGSSGRIFAGSIRGSIPLSSTQFVQVSGMKSSYVGSDVTAHVLHAWTEFARAGVPSSPDGTPWPSEDSTTPQLTVIDDETQICALEISPDTALINSLPRVDTRTAGPNDHIGG
jgi:hypothetical protein